MKWQYKTVMFLTLLIFCVGNVCATDPDNNITINHDSNVTIDFDDKFKTYDGVWEQTGSKDIGDGDIIDMCYVEGFSEHALANYPFVVRGYTADGPGLLYHQITKIVYYYEENGQIFTKTVEEGKHPVPIQPLISLEPPKKPIKAVVYLQ